MISRFTKHFLLVFLVLVCPRRPSNPRHSNLLDLPSAAAKILLASVTLYHRPIPSYLDLRTGALFGDGGVEKEFHALPIQVHDRPPAIPHATGSVIMSKLGNETVKCAIVSTFDPPRIFNARSQGSFRSCYVEAVVSQQRRVSSDLCLIDLVL